jgi:large subunit ribosomal protein L25
MSKQVALAVSTRQGGGKGEARSLRRSRRVPGIAYGAGLDATAVSVDALELYHALHTDAGLNAILRLDLDGETHLALAREIQRHPVRRDVMHVDFVTVSRDVKVTVDVPIVLEGEAPGSEDGGVVDQVLHALHVEVLPLEVPDQLVLDVSDMHVGDVKRVSDIRLPGWVQPLVDLEEAVVSVAVPTLEVPEEEAAAAEEAEEAVAGEGVPGEEQPAATAEAEETGRS